MTICASCWKFDSNGANSVEDVAVAAPVSPVTSTIEKDHSPEPDSNDDDYDDDDDDGDDDSDDSESEDVFL